MQTKKHHIDIIFIIVLTAVFALSSMMLAILGVNVYKETAAADSGQELNTACLYFAQKVRQCENKSAVRIASLEDNIPALVLESEAEGKALETWIFVYDGLMKEVVSLKGNDVSAAYGQEIGSMQKAFFELRDDGLLKVGLKARDGAQTSIALYIPGQQGGGQ